MTFENNLGRIPEGDEEKKDKYIKELIAESLLPDKQKGQKLFDHLDQIYAQGQAEYEDLDAEPYEATFRKYFKKGKLKEDELQKTIFDLGCGNGEFIKYILSNGYGSNLYGLDKEIEPQKMSSEYKPHFKKGDFSQEIPFKEQASLILYSASIEQMAMEGKEQEIKQSLELALEKLTPDGQIRIFPLRSNPQIDRRIDEHQVSKEEREEFLQEIEKMKKARSLWDKILEDLQKKELIDYQIIPTDFETRGKNNIYWLEEVLIINKPKK
ncbi:MAG: hypothetical protein ACP5RX_03240 [Minisyncoccia bacterium]